MEKELKHTRSHALFQEAQQLMPGGVNSPVRAFRGVGGEPVFIDHAEGPYLYDVDGNRYLDFVQSWGPMILGFGYPSVLQAVIEASKRGFSFGAPTEAESELAKLVMEFVPSVEMIRFVNSGTEATMSALRVARAFTGRSKIVKFTGCYHGHADMLLVQAGSGVATLGLPDSPGVPAETTANTLTVPYNDSEAVKELFKLYPAEIAAVIVEPVAANMGLVLPQPGFLETLRELTSQHGALLIFDEVMTGFRVALGGMQQRVGIRPDLTCFGKIIGGGMPVGAYGGRKDIMQVVAPIGPMYQAGTLSGNPLAMAAGIATLKELRKPGQYEALERKSLLLGEGLERALRNTRVEAQVVRIGAMFCLYFTSEPVTDYASAKRANTDRFSRYFWEMLAAGYYLPPSQFEACFISLAQEDVMLEEAARTAEHVLRKLA
ncbi:glutamate-1-semialdehyde 2,1-aminomutase [Thermosporothrix hazakensis]|jgi:glutamate-1-semialdehyde 2,1-aminomutase|uniref:Glutamate-1-semialdehyde 2,1-aminomutase n=2 Tax=Thermosporothrix TaxID=768650 RepID=A0A326UBH3_THEHA|nr:glutamate-1-semialdehyde 2,1-aminomutase [Thermosporothrix hazakensis]PZW30651.1 glutamate-1-semialdehyde 2,1-aminomutase [Thermosporothrix hazakensis]BBH91367.1 glutamate-1-semialdehyde 2,1-aminomutase [Thermosporothrix sp. COM3]GCE49514.1 glutamate-1-semialdehyde 2,1-aminomutase [Thermosporothrix hazakensis]